MRLRQPVEAEKGFENNLLLSTLKEQTTDSRKKNIFSIMESKDSKCSDDIWESCKLSPSDMLFQVTILSLPVKHSFMPD